MAEALLVRSWNLFHGNTVPPQRRAYLDEMVQLATADDPDVLCLQEVPAGALPQFTVGDVAARPRAVSAELGRRLTDLDHGRLRSLLSGQGNAIQVSPRLRVLAHDRLVLNPYRFRARIAREQHLGARARLAWARERRLVQAVRLEAPAGRTFLVANLHCTSWHDRRLADAELLRAAWFATSTAAPSDVVVLAGDFNIAASESRTLADLAADEWGFSRADVGIDHILVRGAHVSAPRKWPDEQRRRDGRLLSDHAPVEVEIE
jgi:endonuclease/exonuclease/phosphatase family metal-dependent hydrolase